MEAGSRLPALKQSLLRHDDDKGDEFNDDDNVHKEKIKSKIITLKSKQNVLRSLFCVLLGELLLYFGLSRSTDSNIPFYSSQTLPIFCVAICVLLTAFWKFIQILVVSVCCLNDSRRIPECLLSPGWAILFILCALCLAMLCTFGLYTYPSDITYPFGVSLAFGIVSFFFFVASTIGFNHYCRCWRRFGYCWQRVSFYISILLVIWDVVSDVLAATKVYKHHDYRFFTISITFTFVTIIMYWFAGIYLRDDLLYQFAFNLGGKDPTAKYYNAKGYARFGRFKKYWEWTLYFPILSMITINVYFPGGPLIALAFSSFPQYVISLSFFLENGVTDFFNIMALIMSLFQLLSSPLFTTTMGYIQMSRHPSDKEKKARRQAKHTIQTGFLWFLLYVVFLLPILMLEIVHFCPILFEYYTYSGMTYQDLVIYLLFFNLPKFVFVGLINDPTGSYKPEAFVQTAESIRELQNDEEIGKKCKRLGKLFLGLFVYGSTFLVLPLVPVTIHCLVSVGILVGDYNGTEHTKQLAYMVRSNLLILATYLLLAYGGMGRMLIFQENVGEISFWMLITTWILSLWILLLPILTPAYMMFFTSTVVSIPEDSNTMAGDVSQYRRFRQVLPQKFRQAMCAVFCPCCYEGIKLNEPPENEDEVQLEAGKQVAMPPRVPFCVCGRKMRLQVDEVWWALIPTSMLAYCDQCYVSTATDKRGYYVCYNSAAEENGKPIHSHGYVVCIDCAAEANGKRQDLAHWLQYRP